MLDLNTIDAEKAPMEPTLNNALFAATEACWNCIDPENKEEHGGIIMHHPEKDEFKFVWLRNANTGTEIAPSLFTADREQYAKEILPMFKEGWRQYASFHTHPQFLPWPSPIDMHQLFQGFAVNYIYSGVTNQLVKYWWADPKDTSSGSCHELVNLE